MYQKDIFLQFRLDTSDHAHISYNDESNGDLRYATNKSGQWVTAAVESNGNVGWYTSLALDASDKAHISYTGGPLVCHQYPYTNGNNKARHKHYKNICKTKRNDKCEPPANTGLVRMGNGQRRPIFKDIPEEDV